MQYTYTAGAITEDFAWVVFMLIVAALQHQWFGNNVGKMRRNHAVDYPHMYVEAGKTYRTAPPGSVAARQPDTAGASSAAAFVDSSSANPPLQPLTEERAGEFNRYQRVHGNNLEILPNFFMMMIIAGISFPVPAAVFGGLWILGRGLYAVGYYKSVQTRIWGVFHYIASLGLIALCIAFGVYLQMGKAPY